MAVSRDLYLKHGWIMPKGFIRGGQRDPNNFTLAQWQQAKQAETRDQTEKDALIFEQLNQSRKLRARRQRLEDFSKKKQHSISDDLIQYREIRQGRQDSFQYLMSVNRLENIALSDRQYLLYVWARRLFFLIIKLLIEKKPRPGKIVSEVECGRSGHDELN